METLRINRVRCRPYEGYECWELGDTRGNALPGKNRLADLNIADEFIELALRFPGCWVVMD
jgi:hypothetical protein